jgi:hypothetical protein
MRLSPILAYCIARKRDHSAIAVIAVRLEDYGPYDRAGLFQPARQHPLTSYNSFPESTP